MVQPALPSRTRELTPITLQETLIEEQIIASLVSPASTKSPPSPCLRLNCPLARRHSTPVFYSSWRLGFKTPNFRDPSSMDSGWSSGGWSHCTVAGASLSQKLVVWLHSDSEFMIKLNRRPHCPLPPILFLSYWMGKLNGTLWVFCPGEARIPLPNVFQASPHATRGSSDHTACSRVSAFLPYQSTTEPSRCDPGNGMYLRNFSLWSLLFTKTCGIQPLFFSQSVVLSKSSSCAISHMYFHPFYVSLSFSLATFSTIRAPSPL